MELDLAGAKRLRNHGLVWIAFAPVFIAMATISTVASGTVYYLQLISFGAIGFSGFICGIGALRHQAWAAHGLRLLSWIVATYFIGAFVLALIWIVWGKR